MDKRKSGRTRHWIHPGNEIRNDIISFGLNVTFIDCGYSKDGCMAVSRDKSDLSFDVKLSKGSYLPHFAVDVDYGNQSMSCRQLPSGVYEFNLTWISSSSKSKKIFDCIFSKANMVGLVECDGVCGKSVHPDEIRQFGECEHNICFECLNTVTTTVAMFDGTPGCCNSRCLRRQLKSAGPRSVGSSISVASAATTSSTRKLKKPRGFSLKPSVSQVYMVNLTVVTFYLEEGCIDRRLSSLELWSNLSLAELKKKLIKHVKNFEDSVIYYSTLDSFHREDLIPLPFADFDDRRLEQLTDGGERLVIIVTPPSISIMK